MSKWGVLRARLKDHLGSYGIGVALTLAGFVVAYQFVAPAPPSTITMATGSPDASVTLRRSGFDWTSLVLHVLLPLSGVLIALVVGVFILLALGVDPIAAYGALIDGAAGTVTLLEPG